MVVIVTHVIPSSNEEGGGKEPTRVHKRSSDLHSYFIEESLVTGLPIGDIS